MPRKDLTHLYQIEIRIHLNSWEIGKYFKCSCLFRKRIKP
jgi:hypothetical protein